MPPRKRNARLAALRSWAVGLVRRSHDEHITARHLLEVALAGREPAQTRWAAAKTSQQNSFVDYVAHAHDDTERAQRVTEAVRRLTASDEPTAWWDWAQTVHRG